MRRIQHLAAVGYRHYTSGEVSIDRACALATKFLEKYAVNKTASQRQWARACGRENAFLLMFPKRGHLSFLWWMLVTDGEGPIHREEKLLPVTGKDKRLGWNGDYELVQLTREGQSRPVITWRMTRHCYASWHKRIRKAVRTRSSDELVRQAIWTLYRSPGFSQVRKQVKRLAYLLHKEWQRVRKEQSAMPELPHNIGYVRPRKTEAIDLYIVAARMKRGLRPFPRRCMGENRSYGQRVIAKMT